VGGKGTSLSIWLLPFGLNIDKKSHCLVKHQYRVHIECMLLSVHKVTFEGVVINLFLLMSADICCGTGALGLCLAQVCFSVQYRSVSVGPYCKSAETVDIIDATITVWTY